MWSDLCCSVSLFKQKTASDLRISDWRSDVCSSDPTSQLRGHLLCTRRLTHYRRRSPDSTRFCGRIAIPYQMSGCRHHLSRSDARRVETQCVSPCRSRLSPYHYKKQINIHIEA